jgi:lipoprotein-releasing system permease protein
MLALLIGVGAKLAIEASYDPKVVTIIILFAALIAFLLTGFTVSARLRRLAFTELVVIALVFGFVLYLGAATIGVPFLKTFNIPKEQILVVLAFVPSIIALCFLSVGASIGFLLTGAGSFDPHFGYELLVGRRFLRSQIKMQDVFWFLVTGGVGYLVWNLAAKILSSRNRRGGSPQTAVGSIMVISIAGVALGVMALVVVLSVMSGFEEDLKTKILGAHSHIVVQKKGDDFVEYEEIVAKLSNVSGVRTTAAFVMGEGMVSSDGGLSGVLIKGLNPKNGASQDLRRNIEQGNLDHLLSPEKIPSSSQFWGAFPKTSTASNKIPGEPVTSLNSSAKRSKKLPGVVIGRELARTLRVGVGSIVRIVSPTSEEIGPTGPQPKLRRFRVAAVFFSGMYEYDSKFAYVLMKRAQKFLGMRKKASGVELRVLDVSDTAMITEEIKRRVGGHPYTVKDWREMNKELFSALLLEKLAMFIVLIFIVLVASFNIVSTLVMIVLERGREIAILKSMGASRSSIMKIFVVQGLIVGVGGAVLGLIAGVSICWLIENFGLPLDKDIFYIDRLPVVMNWVEITIIAVSAIMVTYLATIYPAMAAAQLRPVEGLRGE